MSWRHLRLGTWLLRDTSSYDDNVTSLQRFWELVWTEVPRNLRRCLDVAEVCRHAWSAHNVVEGEVADEGTLLEQERHGLAYSASSTQHCNLETMLHAQKK